METFWDWATLFCFAGLVTLLLQRSAEETPRDSIWQYAPPAIALAVANYLGNHNLAILAAVLLVLSVGYIFWVLKVKLPWGGK